MVRPERRTKADLAAVVVILVVVLAGAVAVWAGSDVRGTVSQTAPKAPKVSTPATVPDRFTEVWRAPSPATPIPAVAGPAVVTAGGNEVLGRDPATGAVRWRYARDLPLCTVGAEWKGAIAVYRKAHNCSEVTSLSGSTGERGPQRNSDAELGTRLVSDGTYVSTTGRELIESWRSDLVRTQQFGLPTALKNPKNNLTRPECGYESLAVGDNRFGVIENCPGDPSDRVTLMKSRPSEDEKPEEVFTTLLGYRDSMVVSVTEQRAAVALYERGELAIFGDRGGLQGRFPVRLGPPPPDPVRVPVTATFGKRIYWFTGMDTVALDGSTLNPQWTVPRTLGPGTLFAGKLLLPIHNGLSVHDARSGRPERIIPIDRQGYQGTVQLDTVGDVVVEQRGDTVVALH